jgi:hypothetical protein
MKPLGHINGPMKYGWRELSLTILMIFGAFAFTPRAEEVIGVSKDLVESKLMTSESVTLIHCPFPGLDQASDPTKMAAPLLETLKVRYVVNSIDECPSIPSVPEQTILVLSAGNRSEHAKSDGSSNSEELSETVSEEIGAWAGSVGEWVESGGRMLLLIEPGMTDPKLRMLLGQFGIILNPVRMTGKHWRFSDRTPLFSGQTWSTHVLGTLDAVEDSEPMSTLLVVNDLSVKPRKSGQRDYPGAVMVLKRRGEGRVGVVAAGDWISPTAHESFVDDPMENGIILKGLLDWLSAKSSADLKGL